MSTLNVDKVDPSSGTALELGTSGDTITVPTGAGLTVVDEVKTNKISPATGVAFALGDSGDTFTVPSGATIVNSGTATGFGGGKIGQVIHATSTGEIDVNNSSSFVDTNLSGAITPSATSSKVLAMWTHQTVFNAQDGTRGYGVSLERAISGGATSNVFSSAYNYEVSQVGAITNGQRHVRYTWMKLDSPSTTSAITYSPQAKTESSGYVQFNSLNMISDLILMEVLA
jgi:hypothetical protein